MDTLAVRLTLPTTKRVVDFHHQAIAHAGRTTRKICEIYSNLTDFVVEVTGFEPATFWSRTKRATKLRYTSLSWSQ